MLRALAATLALTALIAAASAPSRPASPSAPTKAETAAQEKLDTEKREAAMKKNQSATEARDKAWDAKTKGTMSSICRGC